MAVALVLSGESGIEVTSIWLRRSGSWRLTREGEVGVPYGLGSENVVRDARQMCSTSWTYAFSQETSVNHQLGESILVSLVSLVLAGLG